MTGHRTGTGAGSGTGGMARNCRGPNAHQQRSVRIASGQPGILGHGAGYVDATPSSFTPSTACSPDDAHDYSPAVLPRTMQMQPNGFRLSQAVAAMSAEGGSASGTPDSIAMSSEASRSSSKAGGKVSRKPNVIRKHASQPNMGAPRRRPQTAPQMPTASHAPEPAAMHRTTTQMQPMTTAQLQQAHQSSFRVGGLYSHNGEEMDFLPAEIQEQHFRPPPGLRHSQSVLNPRAQMMVGPEQHGVPSAALQYDGVARPPPVGHTMTTSTSSVGSANGVDAIVAMRSVRGMRGLEQAERGEAMISLDRLTGAGFETGEQVIPERVRMMDERDVIANGSRAPESESASDVGPLDSVSNVASNTEAILEALANTSLGSANRMLRGSTSMSALSTTSSLLDRQGTLLSASAHPSRRSRELSRVLGNTSKKLVDPIDATSGADLSANGAALLPSESQAVLEHGRSGKARVELDMLLESDLVVEGGQLRGRMVLKIRKDTDKEGPIKLMQPKVRVVGFEELLSDDIRYIFYHQAAIVTADTSESFILHGSPTFSAPERGGSKHPVYSSPADDEGYFTAKEGEHYIPFSLDIPIGKGAKGTYRNKYACVRYIAIGSVKLKSGADANRSIAHFYRHVELYPYLNPAVALSSAPKPIQASVSKGLFMGGQGKVNLTASLHRSNWVAGQRVYVRVGVQNETSKKIKSVTLALLRTLTLFRPREDLNLGSRELDPDACATSTSRKKLSEETLEMGQRGANGTVTARGWWTGVAAGGSVDFSHSMTIPADALSISRGRHVEVLYSIKVSLSSSMSSNVSVELPLHVINFVSLDPPPGKVSSAQPGWQPSAAAEAPLIDRVRSMEVMTSPAKAAAASHLPARAPAPAPAPLEAPASAEPDDAIARARRLQHQKSLDFIQHAIRSATARRIGTMPTDEAEPTGLGIAIDEQAIGEVTPTPSQTSTMSYESGISRGASVSTASTGPMNPACMPYIHPYDLPDILASQKAVDIDDMDDSDDDGGSSVVHINDDSIDEVDIVLGSATLEDQVAPAFGLRRSSEEEEEDAGDTTAGTIRAARDEEAEVESPSITSPQEPPQEVPPPQKAAQRVLEAAAEIKPASASLPPKPRVAAHAAAAGAAGAATASPTAKKPSPSQRVSPPAARMTRAQSGPDLRARIAMLEAVSPAKEELRQKKSFTFATADAPVKIRSPNEAPRAKVRAGQVQAKAPAGRDVAAAMEQHKPSSSGKKPPLKHKKSAARNRQQQARNTSGGGSVSSGSSQASGSPASLAPSDGASDASSASSPASSVVRTPDTDASGAEILTLPQQPSPEKLKPLAFTSPQKVETVSRPEVFSTPHKAPVTKLRGTVSLANLKTSKAPASPAGSTASSTATGTTSASASTRLSHSSSTHNLRGAALVVPSVRNKIAALESRQATLRELTGADAGAGAGAGSDTDSGSSSIGAAASTHTTPKASRIAQPTAITPTGRVAQLAASAEAAARRGSVSSGSGGSPTSARTQPGPSLARKTSALSIASSSAASSASSADLRRAPSVLSFKAPVFKPAHLRT